MSNFGTVRISIGFDVDLDELADNVDITDRDDLENFAKRDFVSTLLNDPLRLIEYVELETVDNYCDECGFDHDENEDFKEVQ